MNSKKKKTIFIISTCINNLKNETQNKIQEITQKNQTEEFALLIFDCSTRSSGIILDDGDNFLN